MSSGWLVVSDVDHTLIETPDDASLAGACLRRLQRRGLVTLLASSKTFAEMVVLQEEAGLPPQPFLFENGSGVGWPVDRWPSGARGGPQQCLGAYGAIVSGEPPERLACLLLELRQRLALRFSLLAELSWPQIQRQIGLTQPRAQLALQRLASLPLVWNDTAAALERLQLELARHGLSAVHGGRLLHISAPGGKGEALQRLRPWLAEWGLASGLRLLACGDSENDRSLLESAAIALVFHPPQRPPLRLAAPAAGCSVLRRSVVAAGPRAWLEAVEAALAQATGDL